MNNWIEKIEARMKVGDLPSDFGKLQAQKSMESLNSTIHDILFGNQDDLDSYQALDSYQFNERFIKSIKNREKQKSYEIKDLD